MLSLTFLLLLTRGFCYFFYLYTIYYHYYHYAPSTNGPGEKKQSLPTSPMQHISILIIIEKISSKQQQHHYNMQEIKKTIIDSNKSARLILQQESRSSPALLLSKLEWLISRLRINSPSTLRLVSSETESCLLIRP